MAFEDALKEVLKVEGGLVNHPNDRGGITNYGITHKTLAEYLEREVTAKEVIDLDMDTVRAIYKEKYWNPLRLDHVQYEPLAHALFDQAVNRGVGRVAKEIQVLVDVDVDGIVGSQTLRAINSANGPQLLIDFVKKAQLFYCRLAKRDRSQVVFLEGWMARTHRLLKGVV